MYFHFIVNRPSKRLYESDSGTDENETDTESRPPQVIDQATTPKESQSLLSSPPRLSAQALREASSDVQSASPIQGASDTPFRGQIIGPSKYKLRSYKYIYYYSTYLLNVIFSKQVNKCYNKLD